jgi:hypothetical protein
MTDIQTVRLLIGDQASAAYTSDADIQQFLDLNSIYAGFNDQFYMAAYLALKSLGAKLVILLRGGGSSVKIGDFEFSSEVGNISKAFLDQAQGYYDLVMNTPAFAIAEENLSVFNELIIIENWIYRTQLP